MKNLPRFYKAFGLGTIIVFFSTLLALVISVSTPEGQTVVASNTTDQISQPITQSDIQSIDQTAPQPVAQPVSAPALSNSNYYVNSIGDTVHSPAWTNDNSVPDGATARCGDGSYSFSQHRSGTCSHHGGVAEWL